MPAAPNASPLLDNLLAAWTNASARLAELDALTVEQHVVFTYSEGGRTYGFNEYRASMLATVEKARLEYVEARKIVGDGNLFTITSGTVRG